MSASRAGSTIRSHGVVPDRSRVRASDGRHGGSGAGGEGFGLVFLEAAAAGVPVVAGRAGAVPEVVEDGETGLLWSRGIRSRWPMRSGYSSDETLRSRMGRAARVGEDTFSYAAFGDGVEPMRRSRARLRPRE